tara:strand:- start:5605 stop:6018 length:414 start_codon:yes stop_codon:yes gene_type:complete
MPHLSLDKDFVFFEKNGYIGGGGYKINSLLLENNISPMTTDSNNIQISSNDSNYSNDNKTGGGITSIFQNLAVPAGLLLLQQKANVEKISTTNKNEVISPKLHDSLLDKLSSLRKQNKRKTRKNKTNTTANKRTRRK